MAHVHYKTAIVTYLDILGFKELIDHRKASDISRIIRVVKEAVQPARFKTQLQQIPDDQYVNFSDLSVIATPLQAAHTPAADQLFSLLMHLVYAQSSLIVDEGILIRGAITIGEVVKSWGQLFGPAVVRAYELERGQAKYPRIIVDDKIFKDLDGLPHAWRNDKHTDKRALRKLTCRDSKDRKRFVDYLCAVKGELDDPIAHADYLDQHRSLINNRLKKYARDPSIHQKYEWLDNYHVRTIAKMRRIRR